MPVPAKVFRNKTPSESADIANAKIKAAKKSAAKKADAAEAAAEAASGEAKLQGAAQAGITLAADAGMEAIFTYSKAAANYEGWAAGAVTVGAGLGAVATDGYLSSGLMGLATAAGGRLARKGVRMAMGAA